MEQKDSALFSSMAYSYTYFIDQYLTLLNHSAYTSCEYIDEELHMICTEMQTLFLSMPNLLGGEESFKEISAKKLITFREILESKYRLVTSYTRELQHITSFFNLTHSLEESTFEDFGMSVEDAQDIDFTMIAKDCVKFIFAENTPVGRQYRASLVLPHVPMRMTKDNFITYVEKALHKISIENTTHSATLLTSILNQQFSGHNYPGYGKELEDIALSLEELKTIQEPDTFFDLADMLDETLTHLTEMLHALYTMICSFSNLLIFDDLTFNTLTDMHVSFYDLYCSIQGILANTEDSEVFLETLPERVETILEEVQASYDKVRQTQSNDPLFILADTYLNMSLQHTFGFDVTNHEPYSDEIKKIFKNFLENLQNQLTTLSPKERKLRMQYFISILPFMMNDDSCYKYIMQGFTGASDLKRHLFTSMYLTSTLEQMGYFTEGHEPSDGMIPYNFDDYEEHDDSSTSLHHHDHNCCDHHH